MDCDHSNTFPSGATKRLGFVFSEAAEEEEEEEEDGAEGDEEDKDETEDEAGLNTASSELYAGTLLLTLPASPRVVCLGSIGSGCAFAGCSHVVSPVPAW